MGSHSSTSSTETSPSTWRKSKLTRTALWRFVTRCEDIAASHGTPPKNPPPQVSGAFGLHGTRNATWPPVHSCDPAIGAYLRQHEREFCSRSLQSPGSRRPPEKDRRSV